MKTTSALMGVATWLAVASGCGSQVVGGGGGAGGAGGAGPTGGDGGAVATGSATAGEGASTGEGTSSGGGGANALGACESGADVTVGALSGGTQECGHNYACEGGDVLVECLDDGTTEICECYLDGAFAGECVEQNGAGCQLPVGCCYALLGGNAQPNPGPYGACTPTEGSVSAVTASGGETACLADYTCDGGQLDIGCTGTEAGVTCECRDGQGFLLATCEQPTVDCDYASGCCRALVN